jgi:short subunit dehydrogenase-like uncharacterized protein
MQSNKIHIMLFGATGYTGSLIAQLLHESGFEFYAFGRNLEKLQGLKDQNPSCLEIAVLDLETLSLLSIAANSLIINCVGPFNVYAGPIVHACVQAGAMYIDITGEQEIVRQSFSLIANKSLENSALVVHSMAFESAMSDLLLVKSKNEMPAATYCSFNTYYLLNSKQMSPGTRITMKVTNAFPTYALQQGEILPLEVLSPTENPDPIAPMKGLKVGYPEPILAKAHGDVLSAQAHFLVEPTDDMAFLWSTKPTSKMDQTQVDSVIERHNNSNFSGPTLEERQMQTFEIHTYLQTNEKIKFHRLLGRDMYGLTAELVVLSVQYIEQQISQFNNRQGICGVQTPGQLLREFGQSWLLNHPHLMLESKQINK